MPSWKAWVERSIGLIKRGRKRKCFKLRLNNCFNENRECFTRSNIRNQCLSLQDNCFTNRLSEYNHAIWALSICRDNIHNYFLIINNLWY